jgi:hypothetical protein
MPNGAVLARPLAGQGYPQGRPQWASDAVPSVHLRVLQGGGDQTPAAKPHFSSRPHPAESPSVKVEFEQLAAELEAAGALVSSTRRLMRHRAFVGILALGPPVIPLVLDRLRTSDVTRPVWLRVIGSLLHAPPGAGQETVDAAANVWLRLHRSGSLA